MADIKFACPSCSQHITCDELWCGQEIQCPICQAALTVPPKPAPAAAPRGGDSLVPKPPVAAAPKLSIGAGQAHSPSSGGAPAAPSAPKNIPIRNLAPPPQKKTGGLVKILGTVAVLAVLGVGGYFGFNWLMTMQEKSNSKRRAEEANNDGGQVGHIADLNAVLDATEPGGRGLGGGMPRPSSPRTRPSGVGQGVTIAPGGEVPDGATAAAAAEKPLPIVPPVYMLEANLAKIPEGRVNGVISGTNFVAETVRLDPSAGAQILRFTQGALASPDREILVYLHIKAGEKIGGQSFTITKDMRGGSMPTVMKRWKTNPKYAPKQQSFSSGFAMKLELGTPAEGTIPGKIILSLPDTEQTVIGGVFKAASTLASGADAVAPATPAAVPAPSTMTPADRAMYEKRYGVK